MFQLGQSSFAANTVRVTLSRCNLTLSLSLLCKHKIINTIPPISLLPKPPPQLLQLVVQKSVGFFVHSAKKKEAVEWSLGTRLTPPSPLPTLLATNDDSQVTLSYMYTVTPPPPPIPEYAHCIEPITPAG